MTTTVVLFTRDLRVHDHPALHAAVERASHVVPVFVLDDGLLAGSVTEPRRVPPRGARRPRPLARLPGERPRRPPRDAVAEVLRVAADTGADRIHLSEDVSGYRAGTADDA